MTENMSIKQKPTANTYVIRQCT